MADQGGPNYKLQIAELEMQIAQQELNIRSATVRLMQLSNESDKIQANVTASEKQIAKLQKQLNDIQEPAHG